VAFSVAPLLIHSDAVPIEAREALKAASAAPPEFRQAALESAACELYRRTDLQCSDVRDLFGLTTDACACDPISA